MEHLDTQKWLQFMFGLNEAFFNTRNQLLLMIHLPTINQAYSMLSQDESQRMVSQTSFGETN